ncbi:hypothetical protein ACFL5L_06865, partial [candidate division KSB1 bacterium]
MLSKLSMNFESNVIEEILISLKPDIRKVAIRHLKTYLHGRGIKLHSRSDIAAVAEENLTLKEIRMIFKDIMKLMKIDPEEIKRLKGYYLG